jgi:uncharacterized delta-60 repeat protein
MSKKNVIFIDSRVADYQTIVTALPSDTDWYLLDRNSNGVSQMQSILANYSGLDSIQIFSHGSVGAIQIGSGELSNQNLADYQSQLAAIGSSLTETGDILLYGCNVAQGNEGQKFVNALATRTGADVAASSDLTGFAALGGDWELESVIGVIEFQSINNKNYNNLLLVNSMPTFYVFDGNSSTSFSSLNVGSAYSCVVQENGKIIATGYTCVSINNNDFALARYNIDGSLDKTFGIDGKVTTDFLGVDGASSVVLASGKIVVAGGAKSDFALSRYNNDGSLDISFDGDGKVTTDFGSQSDYGSALVVQLDGKILVAGQANGNFALARYNIDGSLDTGFGVNGKVNTDFGSNFDYGHCVALQKDGKIVMAGGANGDFALSRYNNDGSFDISFDGDGKVTTDFGSQSGYGSALVVQLDGKILVAGQANGNFALARYNIDGSLDTGFGVNGKVNTDFGNSSGANNVIIQGDGKIVAIGYSKQLVNGIQYQIALARYNIDGTLDLSFNGNGKVLSQIGSIGHDVSIQNDGKILIAGEINSHFGLTRFNEDGTLDFSFAPDNTLDSSPTYVESNHGGFPILLDANVQVYDPELVNVGSYNGATLTISRHNESNIQDLFRSISGGTLTALTQSSYFAVNGVTIGRVTTNSNGILKLTFNTNATQALVDKAMQQIAYSNTSDAPPATVQIDWTFDDGNTGDQGAGGALSVTGSTTVNITPTNDAPLLSGLVPDQTAAVDHLYSYTIPAGTFTDPDLESLTYSISMANGTGFPPWLSFNPTTRTLSGTPSALDAGSFSIRLKATDSSNTSAVQDLMLNVVVDNSAPIVSSFSPLDGITGVAVGSNITVTFSEEIQRGSGNIQIHSGSANGVLIESYDVATSPNLSISATNNASYISLVGTTLTINPTYDFGSNADYFVTFDSGSIKDLVGNSYAGTNTYDFTTVGTSDPRTFTGTTNADVLYGSYGNDVINSLAGNDQLSGLAGNDSLDGGDGRDVASYSDSPLSMVINLQLGTAINSNYTDILINIENVFGSRFNDVITGDAGDNNISGGAGDDMIDGGDGVDRVDYYDATSGVDVNLVTGIAYGLSTGHDVLSNIENIHGSSFSDTLTGNDLDNLFKPYNGSDTVNGGGGLDTVDYSGTNASINIDLSSGNVVHYAYNGNSVLSISSLVSIENSISGQSNDTINGSNIDNYLDGQNGSDYLNGLGGNDTLSGGAGDDALDGGDGNDIAVYQGVKSDYIMNKNSDGSWTVTDSVLNRDGVDTLTNVEKLQFHDQVFDIPNYIISTSDTYWDYWYSLANRDWKSGWNVYSFVLGVDVDNKSNIEFTVSGSLNIDPYAHDDGGVYAKITNAAGVLLSGSYSDVGTILSCNLNLPNGELLTNSPVIPYGALMVGNPDVGWRAVFKPDSNNGYLSNTPSENLVCQATVNSLFGGDLPSGTRLFFTYNDIDNSNIGKYNLSVIFKAPNIAPTLTTFVAPVATGNEDTEITVTLANLKAQGDEADADGTVDGFVIKAVYSGSLRIGSSAETAIAWALDSNDVVDAQHLAFWTPPANANGEQIAFAVVAKDDGGLTSEIAVEALINVTSVNDAPTLTTFAAPVTTGNKSAQIAVTFTDLQSQGNEADIDGVTTAFVIKAVSSGTLKIGATAQTATAWNAVTNKTVNATYSAYWTPDANAKGELNAFTVVAKDNQGLESMTAIQAKVTVLQPNHLPTGEVVISGSLVQGQILTASNTLQDVDGIPSNGIHYQWQADGINIVGATNSTFILTTAQTGKRISVVASYTDLLSNNETVSSSVTAPVGVNLTGTSGADALVGTIGNDTLSGAAGNDSLSSLAGDDLLNGGAGTDNMTGGIGNDTYIVDNVGDKVFENANEGIDLIQSSVTYTLSANVENLTLIGTGAINGTGNDSANSITGNTGANILNGGAGNDVLTGLAGNDTYIIDSANDVVVEALDAGTDLVQVAINQSGSSYTLGNNLENAMLTITVNFNLVGNSLTNSLTGNAYANTLDGGAGIDTLIGGMGDDTYIVDLTVTGTLQDTMTEAVSAGTDTIQLRGSSTNASATSLTLADNFENFDASNTGLSLLNLTGNTVNNRLLGNAANNVLSGGTGVDTLIGGAGNDTYIIDNIGDLVYETTTTTSGIDAGGIDLVQVGIATAGGSYTLSNFVENGTLTNTVAFNLTGNSLNNTLIGNAATNTLNGELGNDTLIGGAGVDTFVVNSGTDTITDLGTGGADVLQVGVGGIVNATVTAGWTASASTTNAGAANLKTAGFAVNLAATGGSVGYTVTNTSSTGIAITGSKFSDTLVSGSGTDILTGGLGDDTYVVDLTVTGTLQDTMTEAVSAGTDTIQLRGSSTNASATSLTLADNFENFDASNTGLSLLNLTGNTVNNRLLGNAANNVLSGGTGVDTLIGGAGNDTYIIDNIGDLVYETTTTTSGIDAGGIDLVQVGIATAGGSYTLSNFVENGTLTNTVAFNLTGNSLNNTLIGNAATNTLNGELGNDTLIGGAGVDTFVVNSGTDTITDLGTGGADVLQVGADGIVNATVKTAWIAGALSSNAGSVTITTSALAVNLTAATGTSGYSVINTGNATTLTGSGLADNLTGGIGNDTLSGGVGNDVLTGGLGNDNLTGGSGSDVFLFNTAANASTNKDMITDFVSGTDKLQFSKSIFKLGAVGNLTAAEFKSGNFTGGQDATDRIVYNTSTGALYYDADGNGVAGAVQIALIGTATHPSLAYTDIQIIA